MEPVQQLRKTEHRYDLIVKGESYKFEIGACGEGFAVRYFVELEPQIPEQFKSQMPHPLPKVKHVVMEEHVHPRFYERWLKLPIEKRVKKAAKKMNAELIRSIASIELAQKIEDSL